MKLRTIAAMLAVWLLLAGAALAAESGSVTVTLRAEDAGRTTVRLYAVAEPEAGAWRYTEAFSACTVPLTGRLEPLAAELAAYAARAEAPCSTATADETGVVSFAGLGEGLYLLTQADGRFAPFLVTVPLDGVYTVDATPKMTLAPASPTPTPTPTGPTLPQTGQLWWPVPVLAVLGLFCVAIGWRRRT